MDRLSTLLLVVPIITAVGACGGDGEISAPEAWVDSAPIQTDATLYALRPDWVGLATDISLRFGNQTGRTVYIVNCRGGLAPVLEKWVDGAWETFWSPVLLDCLSPPIVIEPGGELEHRLHVWGALPGHSAFPQFESDDVEGTYRIVLHSMVFNYDDDREGFGDSVPQGYRVSNQFFLDDPRR